MKAAIRNIYKCGRLTVCVVPSTAMIRAVCVSRHRSASVSDSGTSAPATLLSLLHVLGRTYNTLKNVSLANKVSGFCFLLRISRNQ